MVPVGGRACIVCRKHKKQCVVDSNAINQRSRAKKDMDASREGSQKRRSRESSEEPDSRSQKRRRVQRKPIIIESNDKLDEPRTERFARKAATEWSNSLMEQWMDKLEWQMGVLSNLVIQLLERDLVLQPRSRAESVRGAGKEAEAEKEKGKGKEQDGNEENEENEG